ncbi:MAG: hypothetical protein ACD_64C00072G0002 [uncultured bacterium]|nr:MAG: hypothetical protein ACD_64C00072G0002 [uncultured bacterium]HLE76539.1 hypothetical protein [Candidatus Babeliales bacterium]
MNMRYFSQRMLPIVLCVTIFLPSCKSPEKQHLMMRPLAALIDYFNSAQGITLRVKKLDKHDSGLLLGERSARLFKRFRKRQPIWPIQISLTNDSNKLISLKASDIDLKQVDYKQVASRLNNNSFTQIFGSIASSLLLGGLLAVGSFIALSASGILLLTTGSLSITAPFAVIGSSALAAIPALLVVGTPVISTVRGIQTAKHNTMVRREIKNYSLKEQLIVEPYKTVDIVIFVSKSDYKSHFTIDVSHPEKAEEKVRFNVRIPESPYIVKK